MDILTARKLHPDLFEEHDNCGFGLLANVKNIPSRQMTLDSISALSRMIHRGAVAADGKSGDGCGLLFSMPDKFMRKIAREQGVDLPNQYAVGNSFLADEKQKSVIREFASRNDIKIELFRDVPINPKALGEFSRKSLPRIVQFFAVPKSPIATERFEALLYLTRKELEHHFSSSDQFYIASFSSRTICYKGLVMPTHIKEFFNDLRDEDFEVSFTLFHQRFSTNTLPRWTLAQPFRAIAHNGEINSIAANRFNVSIKSAVMKSPVFSDDELARIFPILEENVSDSASLDNMLEFLLINDQDFFRSIRMLIPAPWQNAPHMDAKLRAFYEYTSARDEAWDGPAAISLTNGRYIGCILDRNGLRPAKYTITNDDRILISSEFGVLDLTKEQIKERGKLKSGQMIAVDLKFGSILKNKEINAYLKELHPYSEWLNAKMSYLLDFVESQFVLSTDLGERLVPLQRYFQITNEMIEMVIKPMAETGKEATGSMGDDTPSAAFSDEPRPFSDFFRQRFAQVTNPPIDPLREKVVMSTNTGFGQMTNILAEEPIFARRLKADSPALSLEKLNVLLEFGDESKPKFDPTFKNRVFSTAFKSDLRDALQKLYENVSEAVRKDDIRIVVLDDRALDREHLVIPMAMAVGFLNRALLKNNLRHLVSILCITSEVQDAHSAAILLAFGANAFYAYLLFATVADAVRQVKKTDVRHDLRNVQHALKAGLLKIMSKMGISTIASYRNSALFDTIGLSDEIVNECFSGVYAHLGGLRYEAIEKRLKAAHRRAFFDSAAHLFPLDIGGFYRFQPNGEYHDFSPSVINAIHTFAKSGRREDYDAYKSLIENRGERTIRDFLLIKSDREPIDITEVEPIGKIITRIDSAAMSIGAISKETHEAIAEALNKLGGRSNSGEGGEDEARFGTSKVSKIKQIASGRFGVTTAYLRNAEEIQIKIAQGAKPGEGGQLPGYKVSPYIAKLRFTIPGVTLISPPPHHDIYSIEDLAQLIFDLKQVNPKARISVKLVSIGGVGTIAAGVVKAYADKIVISGCDGGTGAAQLSSIKFAGDPWELGLAEAHDVLKANSLREFITLQTDGGLKVGQDIVKAALLGAESYGFGTAMLAALGCRMLRVCHLNRCTAGVATQDSVLREHFVGTVERLENFLTLLAEDVRLILARMGYGSIEEIVGRRDLLQPSQSQKAGQFDFSKLLRVVKGRSVWRGERNDPLDRNEYEKSILKAVYPSIKNPDERTVETRAIQNVNRSVGALISGEIAQFYGDKGLPDGTIALKLSGVAGQSLGAFLSPGVNIEINGVANDYVGKGMHGGKIVVVPQVQGAQFSAAGNTCLYGATGGRLYVAGTVGERFGIRNSGAVAVVEGTGDHACEYMTGGAVVILGETGVNFGAGMTGGVAFIYDREFKFIDRINQEFIRAVRIDTYEEDEGKAYLKKLLKSFINDTNSRKAKFIMDNFRQEIVYFWMVSPKDMKVTFPYEVD
ncbi:MAG: glutamate synthase large subunit [Helicobacteraceae bacterium]|jgi:glutamate synthase (NADPH/NADH) large chain|nr:glutamate synthase large subunit [Helicobacteraceae bacterium]